MDEPGSRDELEEHPELAGYVPTEGMPHRRHRLRVMRVVVIVGVACLVLPTVVGTWGVARTSAERTCTDLVALRDPASTGSAARFELTGPAGPQWYCYAIQFGGGERLIAGLGPIPAGGGVPR